MKKVLCIIIFLAVALTAAYFFVLPDTARLKRENPKKTSLMQYRETGGKIGNKKRAVQQAWRPLSKISPFVIKAVVIAEDDKFYSHEGFDFEAMKEAMEKNIKAKKFKAGGSTISQQLAKNLYLTPEKTIFRKLKEMAITWKIERTLSKRRILEIYLNVVEWGDGVFGIEAAAQRHFGKSAVDLTADEAARLAAVLPNPRRFNPAGSQQFVEKRAEFIYDIMVRRGIVIPEADEALEEEAQGGDTTGQNVQH